MLLWIGSQSCSNKLYNELQLLNIKNAERFSVKITDLDQSKLTKLKTRTNDDLRLKLNKHHSLHKDEFDRYDFGSCNLSNISYHDLYPWLIKKNKSIFQTKEKMKGHRRSSSNSMKLFDRNKSIVIRCGGMYSKNNEMSDLCDLLLIDNSIQTSRENNDYYDDIFYSNAYYTSLPSLPLKLTSFCLSHYRHEEIIVIGGQNENGNTVASIYTLKLNVEKYKELQWVKEDQSNMLHYQRFGANSCCINNGRDIMIIGGYNFAAQSLKSTEIIKYQRKECELLKDMNYKRYKPGCIKKANIFDQVIVGGGRGDEGKNSRRTIEMFDLYKQEWILYPYKTNCIHTSNPCIWVNKRNENIVYIAGNWIENHTKSSLGTIECVDIRENNAKWRIVNYDGENRENDNRSIDQVFRLPHVDESKWRSRALIWMS